MSRLPVFTAAAERIQTDFNIFRPLRIKINPHDNLMNIRIDVCWNLTDWDSFSVGGPKTVVFSHIVIAQAQHFIAVLIQHQTRKLLFGSIREHSKTKTNIECLVCGSICFIVIKFITNTLRVIFDVKAVVFFLMELRVQTARKHFGFCGIPVSIQV